MIGFLKSFLRRHAAPMPAARDRKHAVVMAGYWFRAAREAQSRGAEAEAFLCMENAYNYVENALVARTQALFKAFKDRVDARMENRLVEMRPGYDDSVTGFNEAWDVIREIFEEET